MVKALRGSLIKCDAAMKQLLLKLNDEEQFVIEDLDETHLVVDSSYVEKLKKKFEKALEENVYKLSDGLEVKATW